MNPIMIEVLIHSCHVVVKRTANKSNYSIYDSFLIKPSAEISAVLSKQTLGIRSISILSFYLLY